MTFWTPPSKFQTESNINPYRSMTMEQMRQNYHNSLTEKMVSPDQLKMLRKEVSEYLQFAKGGGDYQSSKKQLESFVSAVGTGNMEKAKEVFERMNDELQDVIPQQIFKMLGESHLGPEYKYLGKDKKFGREFYEKGGQLFVTKGTGKFVQNLGSVDIPSNKKMMKGLVKESTELEEEKFTSAQLNKLKQEYGKLKTVDPGSPTYTKLTKFLDGLSTEQLQQMVDARIPFLKGLALNRINRRKKDK